MQSNTVVYTIAIKWITKWQSKAAELVSLNMIYVLSTSAGYKKKQLEITPFQFWDERSTKNPRVRSMTNADVRIKLNPYNFVT